MTSLPRLAALTAWIALLWASLQLHLHSGLLGHFICGPWGCAATPEAMAGYHLFWVVLVCPLAWLVGRRASPLVSQTLSLLALLLGGAVLLGMLGWAGWDWIERTGEVRYLVQRVLFVVVTNVDVPVMQTILGGAIVRYAARSARPRPVRNVDLVHGTPSRAVVEQN